MEDLLRIFTNPILLFFIIGAILNYLKKGNEQEEEKGKRKPGSPVRQETQQKEVDWREIFRQEAQTEPAQKKQQPQSYSYSEPKEISAEVQRRNELLEKYEKAKKNKETAKRTERISKESPIYKDDITASNPVTLDFSNITRDEAVKGIVWSEVLGKPRSKGSYRPTLNTRRKQG
ncbi:hypothetical protein H1D32_19370 [Anaerobacillus sp. CMMVII]|uniref:hypothetical protein n=1 Tax=Anaerobacillus sp. CMMVII TaxID=2755588 RepID=UPI0021B79BA4|nr:hypothetical protein [Anaerobacillus sp. CMMVII]MCT8139679.1 hypothetical protein [Anaerobacillus sp. CMMVII]